MYVYLSNTISNTSGRGQVCYGVPQQEVDRLKAVRAKVEADEWQGPEEEEGWLCQRCKATEKEVKDITCVLCPRRGGALKRTTEGKWAHVACALWLNMNLSANGQELEGFKKIPPVRRKLKCYLCKRTGPCIHCHEDCSIVFHPLCGLLSGAYMQITDNPCGLATFIARCRKHTPLHLARGLHVPAEYSKLLRLRDEMMEAQKLMQLSRARENVKLELVMCEFDELHQVYIPLSLSLSPSQTRTE